MMRSSREFIEVNITPTMFAIAKSLSKEIPMDIKHSILNGGGIFLGCLGEAICIEKLGAKHVPSYNFDISIDGIAYEVKTKKCSTPPEIDFDATVFDASSHQSAPNYIFIRIYKSLTKAWIIGKISKEEFFQKRYFLPKGNDEGNLITKADGWNIKHYYLNSMRTDDEKESATS